MIRTIRTHLPADHPWKDSILWFDTIDSTNTQAAILAAQGAPHGTVLIADNQTAGRGRMGRTFDSPAGVGIYMSVILRPQCLPEQLMHLTCATAVAMCDAVEKALGFRPGIKWTNDLVAQGKKLAGILTQPSIDGKSGLVDYVIVGVGINCGQKAADFPPELREIACSAAMITGRSVDRSALSAAMICALEDMSRTFLDEKHGIMERYRQDCVTIGSQVAVIQNESRRTGKALDVKDDGRLTVQFEDGTLEDVYYGEVSVRGFWGYI